MCISPIRMATDHFSNGGGLTAAVVTIMENDERYQGSFPREEDDHNILPVCLQSGAVA